MTTRSPAVPGYDPDISAELYTTNGDTDTHMEEAFGTLGFTPEMSTCETASASDPDDAWEPDGLRERVRVPRRRGAHPGGVREERAVRARGRASPRRDPDDPVSVVGRGSAGLRRRRVRRVLRRRATGGRGGQAGPARAADALPDRRWPGPRTVPVREWQGGERYGDEDDDVLRRVPRHGAPAAMPSRCGSPGGVHRDGRSAGHQRRRVSSEQLHLHGEQSTGHAGARDRQRGLHRRQPDVPRGRDGAQVPATSTSPRSRRTACTPTSGTWTRRACRTISACSSHYDTGAVVPRRQPAHPGPGGRADRVRFGQQVPDAPWPSGSSTSPSAVRDFLNEGGKLIHAGETAALLRRSSAALWAASTTGSTARPSRRAR